MRSLFWRIFLSFWIAMMLIVNAAVAIALWGAAGSLKDTEHMRHLPLAVLAFALAISAAACLGIARYLSAPIKKLRAATKAVAEGQWEVDVSRSVGNRFDELGLLAADFDAMAGHLRTLIEGRQQLTRDLSHELRSPLTRMQIALGLARRSNVDVVPYLDRLELETRRLDGLVEQILRLSKLDDPGLSTARERLDLKDLLEEIVQDAQLEARANHVEIVIDAPAPAMVHGSRELLYSAIENVLRNAVRYTPKGTQVRVSLRSCALHAVVSIRDAGPGVPVTDLTRIFAPFYRSSVDRESDDRAGHGIGLAITSRVLRLHGGLATARNGESGGLEVDLRLPVIRA